MLKLNPNPTFTAPVSIHVPGESAVKVPFTFNYKTPDEYKDFVANTAKGEKTEQEALSEIVAGWENCDAPFSADNFAKLLKKYHRAGEAIFAAYVSELTGARLGN